MTPTTRPSRRLAVTTAAIAFGAASLLGACGDDGDDSASTSTTEAAEATTTEATETPAGDELEITGAWARTSPAVATAGAVYMEISNPTDVDDALVGASVDAGVAGSVELHETTMSEEGSSDDSMGEGSDDSMPTTTAMDGSTDTTGGGMMSMSPVDEVPVPAGGTAVLEPGGYHIMLLDLVEPLEVSSTIELTLTFEQAGEVVLTVDVLDTAP